MRIRACIIAILGTFCLVVLPAGAVAELPPAVAAVTGTLQPRGTGKASWFGFKLYDATLWVEPGRRAWPAEQGNIALAITYARSIAANQLVDTSIDEMRRLGLGDEARMANWREFLVRALPSVSAGETLIGLLEPQRGARFWHEGRLTAEVADAEFARAFFSIWLDDRTREPGLRERLLGRRQAEP